MAIGIFEDIVAVKTRDLTESYIRIEIRLAIDAMIRDMLDCAELFDEKEADDLRSGLYTPDYCGYLHSVVDRLDRFRVRNSIEDLMNFFSTEKKPVTNDEIYKFWNLISVADRLFFLLVPLG
ncbi:hypothetical protein ACGFJT_37015 [Actinomadura geliboluensis]|uniref:hypothetical protein n=1 Tax=Actinomadura geliboluensis TaxID=882440 RepID=UPI003712BF57